MGDVWPAGTSRDWNASNVAWFRAERPEAMQSYAELVFGRRLSAVEKQNPHRPILSFLRRRNFCPKAMELYQKRQENVCDVCGESYERKADLTKHIKKHTPEEQEMIDAEGNNRRAWGNEVAGPSDERAVDDEDEEDADL